MVPLLLVLLLAVILFGAGFAIKILWWVAFAVLVLWLLGFVMRSTSAMVAAAAGIDGDLSDLTLRALLRRDRPS